MKVLITGCSMDGVWYSNSLGKTVDCDLVKRNVSERRYVTHYGEVNWKDGLLLYTESEYNQINQELLRRREEVKQLMIERDGYLAHINLENLGSKLRKVVLPKKVAMAIDAFRLTGHDTDHIIRCLVDRSVSGTPTDRLQTLIDFARVRGYEFISALVNDFTIEEPEKTDEDKFKDGFHHLYQRISVEDSSLNAEKRRAKLADHLNTLAKEIYSKS